MEVLEPPLLDKLYETLRVVSAGDTREDVSRRAGRADRGSLLERRLRDVGFVGRCRLRRSNAGRLRCFTRRLLRDIFQTDDVIRELCMTRNENAGCTAACEPSVRNCTGHTNKPTKD